jgi:hypothetical protein
MIIKELYQATHTRFLKLLRPVKLLLTDIKKTQRVFARPTLTLKFISQQTKTIRP